MRKKFLLIIILLSFFIAINFSVFITRIFADDINVDIEESIQYYIDSALSNNNEINYIYIDSGTFLEQLIINIPEDKEIHLIGQEDNSTIISLPSDVTGNVISADGKGKIYLEKIKITNGTRSGIFIKNGTTVLINNCCFEQNKSTFGGGINNSAGIITINNSKIINNNASFYGGGIYNDGVITITDSLISENSVLNGEGGGISNFGKLYISNSSIYNNSSGSFSGIASSDDFDIISQAENNWWGFESGPFNIARNPVGEGDSISDNVDFEPFLTSDPLSKDLPKDDEDYTDEKKNNDLVEAPSEPPDDGQNNNRSAPASFTANNRTCIEKEPVDPAYINKTYFDSITDFSSKDFITLLYNTLLYREPDKEGLEHWLTFLKDKKENMAKTVEHILFSEENSYRIKNMENAEFISYLYSSLLFREPDTDGFNNWLTYLDKGRSRKNIFTGFINSEEWKSIRSLFD